MRSLFLTVAAALTLSAGVVAQSDLPKVMQDTKPPHTQFKDTTLPDILKTMGMVVNVEIRYQVAGEPVKVPNVDFVSTSLADVFAFLVRSAGLKYTVIDDKTIVVTGQ
jgi:hypothetical protein